MLTLPEDGAGRDDEEVTAGFLTSMLRRSMPSVTISTFTSLAAKGRRTAAEVVFFFMAIG